jgi:predicted transcriptional regulator
MTTAELKKSIFREVQAVNDEKMLGLLLIALENINSPMPELEEWQLKEIEESEKQFERGEVISKEEADEKILKWLKK